MALETKTILKSIYRSLLVAEDIEEGRATLRTIMEAEDVAYVEKNVENEKKAKQSANPR